MEIKSTSGRSQHDIPVTELIVASANPREIARAVAKVGALFVHVEVVQNSPRSGRILLPRKTDYSAKLHRPLTPEQVAFELTGGYFQQEARYNPPEHGSPAYTKGWEIHSCSIDGTRAVIAYTSWVAKLALVH